MNDKPTGEDEARKLLDTIMTMVRLDSVASERAISDFLRSHDAALLASVKCGWPSAECHPCDGLKKELAAREAELEEARGKLADGAREVGLLGWARKCDALGTRLHEAEAQVKALTADLAALQARIEHESKEPLTDEQAIKESQGSAWTTPRLIQLVKYLGIRVLEMRQRIADHEIEYETAAGKWKFEYENACKFANQYEAERDRAVEDAGNREINEWRLGKELNAACEQIKVLNGWVEAAREREAEAMKVVESFRCYCGTLAPCRRCNALKRLQSPALAAKVKAREELIAAALDVEIRFGPHTNEFEQVLREKKDAYEAALQAWREAR